MSALANGVNPASGEIFPADSPYQGVDVVRALSLLVHLVETGQSRSRARSVTPDNAGKPWSADEDQRLLTEFDRGVDVTELARSHGRTAAGIEARLEKHGRLQTTPAGRNRSRWRTGASAETSR